MRRAVEIAERIFARIDRAALESKWPGVRDPPGERRAQLSAQIFTHIQITHARPAAKPFQYAANRKVSAQRTNINRDCSRSLENIENYMRSEEHTSELQSLRHLVCRLLLEKKKK